MLGKTDAEQLNYATSQGRCLVSFNVGDYMQLAAERAHSTMPHSGILVTQQVSRQVFGDLLRRLLAILNTTTADEIQNVLRFF